MAHLYLQGMPFLYKITGYNQIINLTDYKTHVDSRALAFGSLNNNNYLFLGNDGGVFLSNNDGTPIQTVDQMDKSVENLCNSGNTFTKNNVVMLIHDEMFQKSWEESELKALIDKLRSKPNYVFEQMRFYPQ